MSRVLFHSNQLSIRGTEVALYDYAHYNETILGNLSYIAAPANSDLQAYEKFINRFGADRVFIYSDFTFFSSEIKNKIDIAYFIKAGYNDGLLVPEVKNIVHVVFQYYDPHGDVYIYIADWLANKMSKGKCDYLPHILKMEDTDVDYRQHLNIPKDAIVFGRHGGYNEFNLEYTYDPIIKTAIHNKNIYFLFMNTKPINTNNIENILYLDASYDLEIKRAFINTCDAMIHGRKKGEVFSLSMGEFLYCNKPVITSKQGEDEGHIHMLGNKGIYYSNEIELFEILNTFEKKDRNVKTITEAYTPEKVMDKFKIFL